MRLPDGLPIKRSPPKPVAKGDARPKATSRASGERAASGRAAPAAEARPPGTPTAGTQADRLANQRTPLRDAIDTPTPLDALRDEGSRDRNIADERPPFRPARVEWPAAGTAPLPDGHAPRSVAYPSGGSLAPDGIPVAEFMSLRESGRTGEETPGEETTEGADDLAVRVAAHDVSDEEAEQILSDLETLQSGSQEERVQAVFSLAQNLQIEEIGELAESLDIDDDAIVELLSDTDALGAVATLVSADASDADKASAAITLAESTGGLADGSLERALERPLAAISAGQELIALIETFRDPGASGLDRAEAALSFATAAQESLGGLSATLGHDLRRLDSLGGSVSAALTLLDPEASNADRAEALAALFANVPDVRNDLGELSRHLVDQVLGRHAEIAFDVPDELAQALDPRLRESLTPEQLYRIDALGDELLAEGADAADNLVHDLLSKVDDPASLEPLLDLLEAQPDTASRRALTETLEVLKPGALDDLLEIGADGRSGAIALGETLSRLDDEGRAALRKVIGSFDAEAVEVLTRLGAQLDTGTLNDFLRVAEHLPSFELGRTLTFLDDALRAAGVVLTPDIAGRLVKGAGKLVPLVGAVPALYDIGQLGLVVGDTSLPDDIRYLAATGIKINGADAISSVAEAFFGVTGLPIAADVSIGVAALAVDLIVTDQIAKHEAAVAAGEEYAAPTWLTTANVTVAGALGPPGWLEYWAIYGPDDGIAALGVAAESGGTAAVHAAEGLLTLGAEGIGDGLEMTAEGLHLLADIVRNPDVYGERAAALGRQAVERLGELAEGVGELADAARDELVEVVGDLKSLGEDGLEALGWIASNPGEAADIALEAIGDVARGALALGTEAGRAVAAAALDTLDSVIELGGRAAEAARAAVSDVADRAVELGREGIETLGWIASNPGESAEIARQALRDVAVQGGELAHAAYEEILDLGEAGVDLAKDVARELVDLGEDGIEMLGFIASNPGEAADIAVEGLRGLAERVDEAAERAASELLDLAESGVETARDAVQTLLLEGNEAVRNVITALGENIGPGVAAVINGLADLGDAGRDALTGLADAGLDFAMDRLSDAADAISGVGSWAWNNTGGRVWNWLPGH